MQLIALKKFLALPTVFSSLLQRSIARVLNIFIVFVVLLKQIHGRFIKPRAYKLLTQDWATSTFKNYFEIKKGFKI